jgi:hypothetical protein
MFPTRIYSPIFVTVLLCILFGWLINWLTHFTLKVGIHYVATAALLLTAVAHVLYLTVILNIHRHGFANQGILRAKVVLRSLSRFSLLTLVLLAALGWYIVRKDVILKRFLVGLVLLIGYVVADGVLTVVEMGVAKILTVFAALVCLSGYIYRVSTALQESTTHVQAHLLVIDLHGINPVSTPIYRKHRMLWHLFRMIIVYCVLVGLAGVSDLILNWTKWVPPFVHSIADSAVCVGLAFLLSLRKQRFGTYIPLEEEMDDLDLGAAPAEVAVSEAKKWRVVESAERGRTYESGMKLPRPPTLVITPSPGISIEGSAHENIRAGECDD